MLLTTPPLVLFIEPGSQQVFSKCSVLPWLRGRSCCMQSTTRTTAPPNGASFPVLSRFSHMDCSPVDCSPMDCSPQAPLSMKFSRQEYWSGLPFPSPGDLPGIKPLSPGSLASACWFSTSSTVLANPGRRTSDWTFKRHAPFWSLSVL